MDNTETLEKKGPIIPGTERYNSVTEMLEATDSHDTIADMAELERVLKNLEGTLLEAVKACQNSDAEEEGGIIMTNLDETEFKFIKLTNTNTGTNTAKVLWTADREEYAKHILPMFKEGWRQYASFHTHPMFMPNPSSVDTGQLFPGFRINYIYSPLTSSIVEYEYDNGDVNWIISYSISPESELPLTMLEFNGEFVNATITAEHNSNTEDGTTND